MRYLVGFIFVLVLVGGDCYFSEFEVAAGIECSNVGDAVCSVDPSNQILLCSTRTDGPARYSLVTDCGDFDMTCSIFDGEPTCRCEPEGSSRCFDKYIVQVCDADGAWADSETCGEGTECTVQDRVAVCAIAGPCTDGTTRCSSDRSEVETCQGGDWNVTATCEQDQLCNDLGETAQCIDAACTEGETRCADNEVETCNALGLWTVTETCEQDQVCEVEGGEAMCVADSGGTGGTGGTAGTAGTGGTAGSGGTAGTGGTGGGASSCAEVDIPGLPQLTGTLSISPKFATFDDIMIVTVDVDADTREVTASLRNESSDLLGGSGVTSTSGNETVEVNVRVETIAQPGPHTLDIELRGAPPNPPDYILYTPGDGDTYVRIQVEDNVQGPETATSCLVVNAGIEF